MSRTGVCKRPFVYEPTDFFDFGFAGEHPVVFQSWIDDTVSPAKVDILSVVVRPTFGHSQTEWLITKAVKQYPERERNYEDEIREAFENAKRKDWDEVGA